MPRISLLPWSRLVPAKLRSLRLVGWPGHLSPCRVQACIFAQGVICVLLYESHSSGGFVTGRVFGRTRCIQHSFKSAKPCRQVGSSHLLISSAHLVCPARMFVSSVHLVFPARMFLSPAHLVCPARMFLSPAHLVCSFRIAPRVVRHGAGGEERGLLRQHRRASVAAGARGPAAPRRDRGPSGVRKVAAELLP